MNQPSLADKLSLLSGFYLEPSAVASEILVSKNVHLGVVRDDEFKVLEGADGFHGYRASKISDVFTRLVEAGAVKQGATITETKGIPLSAINEESLDTLYQNALANLAQALEEKLECAVSSNPENGKLLIAMPAYSILHTLEDVSQEIFGNSNQYVLSDMLKGTNGSSLPQGVNVEVGSTTFAESTLVQGALSDFVGGGAHKVLHVTSNKQGNGLSATT